MGTVIDRSAPDSGNAGLGAPPGRKAYVSRFLQAVFRTAPVALVVVPIIAPTLLLLPEKVLRRIAGSAGKWKLQQEAAALNWPRLSEAELTWSDGHLVRLVGLVQQHYQVPQGNAERQVARFFLLNVR